MSSRWTGFFIWALVAASAAFWAINIFAAPRPVPTHAQAPLVVGAANGPMERLFGAVVVAAAPVNAPPPESSRFQLVGVIAPPAGSGQGGYAVVSLDNQPARTWRVGSTIDGNTSLLSVSKRGAEFGPPGGPTAFSLQLPEPAAAETGTLQPAVSQPDPAQMQQQNLQQRQMQMQQQAQAPQMQAPQMQPPPQGGQPMTTRGGFGRSAATMRGGYPGPQNNGSAPPRVAVPPDQQNQNDSGAVQQ
ncbi:MAG TPA: hypothetical protein VIP05_03245 [Burkholderiaceae bacterium]